MTINKRALGCQDQMVLMSNLTPIVEVALIYLITFLCIELPKELTPIKN